ncbi:MAG: VCBS repeat-containing protein [Acidobacteriota bacterium]
MRSTPSRRLAAVRSLNTARGLTACGLALCGFAASSPAAAQDDWLTFVDVTSTRLVGAASIGSADIEEKDLISGDVDRDGDIDMLVARKTPFSNPGGRRNVLFMNENVVFTHRTSTLAPHLLDATDDRDIGLVDVDRDGWLDIVTITTFSEQPRLYMNLGEIGGVWQGFDWNPSDNRLPTFSPAPKFCALAVGDVDGVNGPDIIMIDYDNDLEDRLLINDGTGVFTDETSSRMTSEMSESVFGTDAAIVDLDRDGDLDILKVNSSGENPPPDASPSAVRALYNDGTGNFDYFELIYAEQPYMIEVGDFDGNQRPDVFVVDDEQDSVMLNTGNGSDGRADFTQISITSSPNTFGFGGNTKIADMDGDGMLDVLVADVDTDIANCDDNNLVILRGGGTAPNLTFTDPLNGELRFWNTRGTFDIEVLDWNNDGVPDIWAGTCTGTVLLEGVRALFESRFEDGTTDEWDSAVP